MEEQKKQEKRKASRTGHFLRVLLVHVVLWLVLVLVALTLVFHWLRGYTLHDEAFQVPDFSGLREAEAARLAQEYTLRYEIMDSVYVSGAVPGAVVVQQPAAGAYVKQNRTIFLTINALHSEMATMPNLVGLSLRQASSLLGMNGLRLGAFSYRRDIAHNNVLQQQYGGRDVASGRKIPKGAVIDLVLGSGLESDLTMIPQLVGVTASVARDSLLYRSLNIGRLKFDHTVVTTADSLRAVVYEQDPAYDTLRTESVPIGTVVNLSLTTDLEKLPKEGETEKRK